MGFRHLFVSILLLLNGADAAVAADKVDPNAVVKQGEFAARLVNVTGLAAGLPEKPVLKDYLAILGGNRSYTFEAEEIFDNIADRVTVRTFNAFGPFSGKGWVGGTTTPTPVHFRVLLPLGAKYTFSVASKGDGQIWSIAGKAFRVNAGKTFKEVTAGTITLTSGYLDFNVMLPPDGAIDYVHFEASPLPSAAPLAGWQPDEPLRLSALAEIVTPLLDLENSLPDDKNVPVKPLAVAVYGKLPPAVEVTDSTVLGRPVAPKWVKTGGAPATIDLPLQIDAAAAYRIRVHFTGAELTTVIGNQTITRTGKPYLEWYELGPIRLTAGSHQLRLKLSPFSGVDVVELTKKTTAAADYLAAAKITGNPSTVVKNGDLDAILPGIAGRVLIGLSLANALLGAGLGRSATPTRPPIGQSD